MRLYWRCKMQVSQAQVLLSPIVWEDWRNSRSFYNERFSIAAVHGPKQSILSQLLSFSRSSLVVQRSRALLKSTTNKFAFAVDRRSTSCMCLTSVFDVNGFCLNFEARGSLFTLQVTINTSAESEHKTDSWVPVIKHSRVSGISAQQLQTSVTK